MLRALAKSQVDSFAGAEEVGHTGEAGSFDPGEEQSRTAGCDDPTMNFGDLQIRIHRSFNGDKLVFFPQKIKETV